MQSVLNYVRAFDENYAVSFVDASVLDIDDDMTSSNFMAANSKTSFARYISVDKMMMKNEGIMLLFVGFAMDALVVKTLGNTQLEVPHLYISFEEDVFLITQATDSF